MDDLLNTAPCGFLTFTDEGTILEANATLLDLLGYRAREVVGRRVASILTLSSSIFYQTHFFPLIKLHGKAEEIFFSLKSKDGSDIPVLANAVRKAGDGAFVNHCVFIPVHQRRKYEDEILKAKRAAEEALESNQELIQAKARLEQHARELDRQKRRLEHRNRELARLSSILSHELREPIRKVTLFTDLLYQENKDTLTSLGHLSVEKINGASAKMGQLIYALQQLVAVDAAEEALEAVDLAEVVARASKQAYKDTEGDAFELEIESETLPVIEGYRRQLVTLFYHLIDNAVKFRRPGVRPCIHIEGRVVQHNRYMATEGKYSYADFAKILFSDNGIGFDEKYSDYVFEVLKKLDTDTPGLGFGLPICKKVVDNHHGSISVASAPGEGTRFTILLPVEQESDM